MSGPRDKNLYFVRFVSGHDWQVRVLTLTAEHATKNVGLNPLRETPSLAVGDLCNQFYEFNAGAGVLAFR